MTPMLEQTLAELLREAPLRARIFEDFAIDYGSGDGRSLAEACRQRRLDPELVLAVLAEPASTAADPFITLELGALADEIVTRHHGYTREQGPRIQSLLDKATRVHGNKEPRLRALWAIFQHLHAELLRHIGKEAAELYPSCKALAAGPLTTGSLERPIQALESEHSQVRALIEEIRELTDHFTPPVWACNTLRVLYHELHAYIENLEIHLQLETGLLFPALLRREDEL